MDAFVYILLSDVDISNICVFQWISLEVARCCFLGAKSILSAYHWFFSPVNKNIYQFSVLFENMSVHSLSRQTNNL